MRLGPRVILSTMSDDSIFELLEDVSNRQSREWRREPIGERVPWDSLENECYLELRRRRLHEPTD